MTTSSGDSMAKGKIQLNDAPKPSLRVAIVYPFFPHYRAPIMMELINNSKHSFVFVGDRIPFSKSIATWDVPGNVEFINAPCHKLPKGILWQNGLIRVALRKDIDVIIYHAGMGWISIWLSLIIARMTGKRIMNWTHGWLRQDTGLRGAMKRFLYGFVHTTLLYGHGAKSIGIAEGFSPESLHVIYNSLDYAAQINERDRMLGNDIREIRSELFANPDQPVAICTARLIQEKRMDMIIDALAMLGEQGHHVNLLLIGDGDARRELVEFAHKKNVDVHFYGACYDEKVLAKLTMASNVTVSPGNIGLTAIQSLTFGTPVITHDSADYQGPEWEAIIPGKTGSFFRRGDIQDLAEQIRRWTGETLPREDVREACYMIPQRFYNPRTQRILIDRALDGLPADDLFWMRMPNESYMGV